MPRYDDEFEEDQPGRRRRDEDYDDDYDRPRRRYRSIRRGDGDDSWIDQQFANTNIVVLVLFGLCCGWIALVFAIVGVATCQNPTARQNATIVLVVSIVTSVAAVFMVLANAARGPGFP
jgi:hypothetical protein